MTDELPTPRDAPNPRGQDEAPPPVALLPDWRPSDHGPAISVAVHASLLLLLIFGLPFFFHGPPRLEAQKPIAISVIADPRPADDDALPRIPAVGVVSPQIEAQVVAAHPPPPMPVAPQAQPQPAQTQAVQTQAANSAVSDALPYDPSFDPFAQRVSAPSPVAEARPTPAPALDDAQPTDGVAPANLGAEAPPDPAAKPLTANGLPGTCPTGATATAGQQANSDRHAQYLQVCLKEGIDGSFMAPMQRFLLSLVACGVTPMQASDPNMSVEADVTFAPSGVVQQAVLTNGREFARNTQYPVAASRLMRVLLNPACDHIGLPPSLYQSWHQVHVTVYTLH